MYMSVINGVKHLKPVIVLHRSVITISLYNNYILKKLRNDKENLYYPFNNCILLCLNTF